MFYSLGFIFSAVAKKLVLTALEATVNHVANSDIQKSNIVGNYFNRALNRGGATAPQNLVELSTVYSVH